MKNSFHKFNGKIAEDFLALSVKNRKPLALRPVPLSDLLLPPELTAEREASPRPILPQPRRVVKAAPVPSPRVLLSFLSRKYRVNLLSRLVLNHLRLVIAIDNETSSLVRLEYNRETRSFVIRELLIRGEVLISGSLLSSE